MESPKADYEVSGHGSIYIVTPLNDEARENLEAGVGEEAQWLAGGVAVESRFIQPLVEQLRSEGWIVRLMGLTTEWLVEEAIRQVEQMSEQEKAELRKRIDQHLEQQDILRQFENKKHWIN